VTVGLCTRSPSCRLCLATVLGQTRDASMERQMEHRRFFAPSSGHQREARCARQMVTGSRCGIPLCEMCQPLWRVGRAGHRQRERAAAVSVNAEVPERIVLSTPTSPCNSTCRVDRFGKLTGLVADRDSGLLVLLGAASASTAHPHHQRLQHAVPRIELLRGQALTIPGR
jgi:hypothetical protein